MKKTNLLQCFAPLLLAGCASPAPIAVIDAEHPASAASRETSTPLSVTLQGDATTRRTHELIARREKEMDRPTSEGTSSGGQIAPTTGQKAHEHQH